MSALDLPLHELLDDLEQALALLLLRLLVREQVAVD